MPANATSLKRLIHSLSSICNEVLPWMNTSMSEEFQTLKHLAMSLYSSFWLDYLLEHISLHSEKIIYLCLGDCDQDKLETAVFIRILEIVEKWYMKELSKRSVIEQNYFKLYKFNYVNQSSYLSLLFCYYYYIIIVMFICLIVLVYVYEVLLFFFLLIFNFCLLLLFYFIFFSLFFFSYLFILFAYVYLLQFTFNYDYLHLIIFI